jgi:HEAT repeat protein
LDDEHELVRMRAAQALGRIGDRQAVPALIARLNDEFWDVRYAAEDALVALGAVSRQPLRDAFADATPLARRYTVEPLAKRGDRAALPLARRAWRNTDARVWTAVARSLKEQIQKGK